MYQNQPNKCFTGEARLSYVHLSAPWVNPQQPGSEPKYAVTLLIPKTDLATKADIDSSINAAIETAVKGKSWNGVRPPIIKIPIHDGDGTREDGTAYGPECKGMWVMTASRRPQDGKPYVCHQSNTRVELAPEDTYSGMYGRCTVHFFGYNTAGKKGIGCSLDGVMKTRDGESLGGVAKPTANEFAGFEYVPEDVAPAAPAVNPLTGQPMGYAQHAGGYAQLAGGYAQPAGGYAQPAGGYAQQGYTQPPAYPGTEYVPF